MEAIASNEASIEAFHLAMLITSALLLTGGLVSWFGLRERRTPVGAADGAGAATTA